MNAVMYIIHPKPEVTPMTPGKLAAQAAHAAVEAYRLTDPDSKLHQDWYVANHYTKIVLMADDLYVAKSYLEDRGIKCALIIDEGRTEFDGVLTPTALGCALVNKDNPHIAETFGAFKLYKATPEVVVIETDRLKYDEVQRLRELVSSGQIGAAKDYVKLCRETRQAKPKRRWWQRGVSREEAQSFISGKPRPTKPSPLR